jgi:hypothetical protein
MPLGAEHFGLKDWDWASIGSGEVIAMFCSVTALPLPREVIRNRTLRIFMRLQSIIMQSM